MLGKVEKGEHPDMDPPPPPPLAPSQPAGPLSPATAGPATEEAAKETTPSPSAADDAKPANRQRQRIIHFVIWAVFTAWFVTGCIKRPREWRVLLLIWISLTIRLVTLHASTAALTKAIARIWKRIAVGPVDKIPQLWRPPLAGALTLISMLAVTLSPPEDGDNTRVNRLVSMLGLGVAIGGLWATSRNRRKVQWQTVIVGVALQFVFAIFVLKTKVGFDIFNYIAALSKSLLDFALQGVAFVTSDTIAATPMFLVMVLPAIIFFVGIVQLLIHSGWLPWLVSKFALFFFATMRITGAEAVVAAASPFVGQGESAMLVRQFTPYLTDAEMHQIMCSGFATIAGSVLIAYVSMGISPLALISSCVMSIPASLACSKLRWPETDEPLTAGRAVVPDDGDRPANFLHAYTSGLVFGMRVAGMVLACLIGMVALLALANALLAWFASYFGVRHLSIEQIAGYALLPVSFLLGVRRNGIDGDLLKVSKLIGTKLIANEFVAYSTLAKEPEFQTLSPRSRIIATYSLCGFANIASVGVQISILTALAPDRAKSVARVAVSALLTGAIATLMTASIAGMLVVDGAEFLDKPS